MSDLKITPVFSFLVDIGNKQLIAHVEYSQDRVHFSENDKKLFSLDELKLIENSILKKIDKKTVKNTINVVLPDIELDYNKILKKVRDENG